MPEVDRLIAGSHEASENLPMPAALQDPFIKTTAAATAFQAAPRLEVPTEGNSAEDDSSGVVDRILAAITQLQDTKRQPTATYRVQFNAKCGFREVERAVPYLYALGISDLYASPFLQAQPHSSHGYDIVNHAAINPEIGTLDELRSLRSSLREHGMGLIADVVPNHMSNSPQLNAWWQDVLENGPSSPYASYFDIDWMPLKPDLAYKVLLPVLGDQFGKVLEDSQLVVRFGTGSFWLEYFDRQFPLAPRSYTVILSLRIEELQQQLGEQDADLLELRSILTAIRNLPPRTETDPERLAEQRREKEVIKRRLHELVERSSGIAGFVAENLRLINGQKGDSQSFDRLDELLGGQAYRLAYWRVAADEINYRRFFDVNDLAAICTENPLVFAETHRLLFELLDEGTLTGLRIDHPDGLYDPRGYLCQLQEQEFVRLCRRELAREIGALPANSLKRSELESESIAIEQKLVDLWKAAMGIPGSPLGRLLFVVVEKILAHDETIPNDWPVHGTVGYEFLNTLNGLFVAPAGERTLSALYTRFTGCSLDFDALAYQCKRLIVKSVMGSELHVLGHRLDRISERNRLTRDFSLSSLTRSLQEVVACFGVYRTYVEPDRVLERDLHYVGRAVALAKRHNPAMNTSIFDFVHDVLLLRYHDNTGPEEREAIERFVGKFQQLTGPIMGKAVEDTAFYRFNRLVSLNEVGGEPARFGTSVAEFHQLNQSRLPRLSHTLNATSTHDTKRSEDVRARISVLSEIGREWRERVQRWSRWHKRLKIEVEGTEVPSRNSEYLLYQTLVGIWPQQIPAGRELAAFVDRIEQYMLKVVREAKVHTSWISPNEAYETGVTRFARAILTEDRRRPFLRDIDEFARKVADHGRWNSLAQLVLKVGSPGVPDLYQGTEFWTLTLVDPDNRQPVNLAARRDSFDQLQADMAQAVGISDASDAIESWLSAPSENGANRTAESQMLQHLIEQRTDGPVKQFVTLISLRTRREYEKLFSMGEYIPLPVTGKFAENVVAFARRHQDKAVMVIAPRLSVSLSGFGGPPPLGELWQDTAVTLPDFLWGRGLVNRFTREMQHPVQSGNSLRMSDVFRSFPVALYTPAKS
ncbi:MAG: malto-oligosyltrehalose synthase [Pirellulaceae bacterium]